jgi:hypothetical protein
MSPTSLGVHLFARSSANDPESPPTRCRHTTAASDVATWDVVEGVVASPPQDRAGQRTGRGVELTVTDDCGGLSEDDIVRAFDDA